MSSFIQRIRLSNYIACSAMLMAASALNAENTKRNDGIAVVTSVRGEVEKHAADESTSAIRLHDEFQFHNHTIQSGKKSHAFMAFSNGLGFGIDSNTELRIRTYTQIPFKANQKDFEFEPSLSELQLELVSGAISLSCDGLSPRSQTRVHTPTGTLRVHSSNCRIEHDELGTTIYTFDGNATFYYKDSDEREFISSQTVLRISPQSAALGQIAETIEMETVPESIIVFTQAADLAAKRVFFKAPDLGKPMSAVLITPTSYFEQPQARPYEYKE